MSLIPFGKQRYIPRIKRQHQAASGFRRFLPFRSEKSKSPKSVALFILSIGSVFTKCKKKNYMQAYVFLCVMSTVALIKDIFGANNSLKLHTFAEI